AEKVGVPLLANMTEFGKSPLLSFKDLVGFGYRMVIFPQSAFRVSMKASHKVLRALKEVGTQKDWLDEMQTREELYKLLDYDPTAEKWPGLRDVRFVGARIVVTISETTWVLKQNHKTAPDWPR